MVIPRDAYLCGDDQRVVDEVEQVKEACGDAHLKVIVEATSSAATTTSATPPAGDQGARPTS